ncbi:MAG: nucleotidyltransferase domain-containing protein [Nanoarchaeota archaeon]|nr:nucleotidyltransferase domain-containing protein [Nanoarchaeota archaeon]
MEETLKNAESLMKGTVSKEEQEKKKKEAERARKEIEQLKEKLESFKKSIVKKFPFIASISIIPPEASKLFEDEEVKDEKDKKIHLYILIPDENQKDYAKVKTEAIKLVQDIKPKIWVNLSPVKDLWETCYDGKNDLVDAIAMSMPLYDKGLLGSLRVSNIHKIMCLRKFEDYIVSYVIAGSLVRGEATPTSDVDVYIIVNDTDVKRMTRIELRDKLRQIIYNYVVEAGEAAGVENKLSPQIYLLTEFWEGIRDAVPVFFTFVRDGIPIYDRGTFMPWKLLLKMGKITGTPEAIDRFLSSGEKVGEIVKRKLLELATEEIYWSVITPSQGALMIYGLAPSAQKETVKLMREVFYEKEKLLEKKYVDFLEHVVIDIYKGYEHGKVKEVSGKEIDELVKNTEDYIKRLRVLVDEIGKRSSEKIVLRLHESVISLLTPILGKSSEKIMVEKFKKEFIDNGKIPSSYFKILESLFKAKKEFSNKKSDKISRHEVDRIRKDAQQLIALLMEYSQREHFMRLEKMKFKIIIDNKEGDMFLVGHRAFILPDPKQQPPEVKSIDLEKNLILKSSMEELEEALKKPTKTKINMGIIKTIESLLGKKIDLIL